MRQIAKDCESNSQTSWLIWYQLGSEVNTLWLYNTTTESHSNMYLDL